MTMLQKIKTWLGDHWRLLFKSAADNHARIERCREGADGAVQCDINFASYLELKKYQKKFRRLTVSLASAVAMVIVAFVIAPYVMNPNSSSASSYFWQQLGWSGGADQNAKATHPGDSNGIWTKFFSKSDEVVIDGNGDATLTKATNWREAATDFSTNTSKDAALVIDADYLRLLKLSGATCAAGTDCATANCGTNFADANNYCHATANSCVDFAAGSPWERATGYELCSGNAWYKSCASGTWGAQTNCDTTNDYCTAQGDANGGYDLAETCSSGVTGGCVATSCTACTNGYKANATMNGCLASCATNDDTKCVASSHCYSANNTCQSDVNGSCDIAGECTSGTCTGNVCIAPFVCGTDTVAYGSPSVTYNTVQIGSQCWFRQNLNAGALIAGTVMPDNTAPTPNVSTTVSKWCYADTEANCTTGGGLYSWAEANGLANTCNATTCTSTGQGICPTGWHIPSDTEYTTLATYLGATAGSKLSTLTYQGTNSSGFTALLPGYRQTSGGFIGYPNYTSFWSASQSPPSSAWSRSLNSSNDAVIRTYDNNAYGYSVRCLKN